MTYYMSQVLFGGVLAKDGLFKRFEGNGYHLIDTMKCPMYGLLSEERRKAYQELR